MSSHLEYLWLRPYQLKDTERLFRNQKTKATSISMDTSVQHTPLNKFLDEVVPISWRGVLECKGEVRL